jgi:hypothetical protein
MTDVEAHETVREALSDGLNNSNFYVSLNVTVNDAGANADALDFDDLVRRTNQWLDGLDPDGPASDRENLNTEYGPVTVSLSAFPWTPEARPRARPGAVGPHLPVITQWMA